jgi:flagellar basal body P-ring formation protein FlgA
VKVFAPALVATQALAAGTVLQVEHLRPAEADWAAAESPVVGTPEAAMGRTLAQGLAASEALRDADLKKRVWFAIGDPVRVLAVGRGFTVTGEGVALSPGLEGQAVKVRTEGGRTVTGLATGQRRVEVAL